MALMSFREANQVLWRGVRPAHNGTQVSEVDDATDATVNMYTVPDNFTFFLCSMNCTLSAIAAGLVFMNIYDDGGGLFYYGIQHTMLAGDSGLDKQFTFWLPMELPEKYQVRIHSGAAGLTIRASVFGWVE